MATRLILSLILITIGLISQAPARDNGQYANEDPMMKAWFDSLASGKGLCCSFADGQKVEDVDWDTQGKWGYRVRLGGEWIDVPPDTVVANPNRFGAAVVWPYKGLNGETLIRCFLPGAGT